MQKSPEIPSTTAPFSICASTIALTQIEPGLLTKTEPAWRGLAQDMGFPRDDNAWLDDIGWEAVGARCIHVMKRIVQSQMARSAA